MEFDQFFKRLLERSRSMLNGIGLDQKFWVEAVMNIFYLINRSPSSALGDKTPYEVWYGDKPSLIHLRVFGCEAYVHVPKEKRTKLDYKAQKCIFIGYGDGINGYKCWNLESQKIVYNHDVIFREVLEPLKKEEQPRKDELEKVQFELQDEDSASEYESVEEDEPIEEEPQTLVLSISSRERRQPERYSPHDFHLAFPLFIVDDETRTIMEDNLVMAISSTSSALKLEDVVASLLSKEMRKKSFEDPMKDALSMRGGPGGWQFSPSLYYLLLTNSGEPKKYEEAMQVESKNKWEQGMKEEMDSLVQKLTWDLVWLLVGKRALQNKWVYRLKEEDGGKKRYKSRLVVKGFIQKKGIDFDEIFSHVVKMTSIRTLSLVTIEYFHLE
eukprot:Gb_19105 [translate_table: standard]